MGTVIKRRDFPAVIEQARQGVFVLAPNVTVPVNATFVNIGLTLGEKMYKAKADGSPVNITNELDAILGEERRDITLSNTDILFSPEYELDVIKLLLQVGRNQRLYMQWPGEINGEKLTYSEPGRFDFKEYNIKDYVDTYVVLR
ncbi:MAG: BREX-3 system P-loop-containing protein BrxF [Bacteroidia bacterium]|nr:BREX-3 system P-loop-containing protein BrxF [Bacteroidia bacterium]